MKLIDRDFINILPWCVKLDIAEQVLPELGNYRDSKGRIDLGNSIALTLYNKAVAKAIAGLDIDIPIGHLIPTICLRQAYLVCLVESILPSKARILEIGTGPSSIIALLAARLYELEVVATEIDEISLKYARENILKNRLNDSIQLIQSKGQIISGLVEDHLPFDAIVCYPPTYPEEDRSQFVLSDESGFSGTTSEMIGGGETGFQFIKQYITEACLPDNQIKYVTIMLIFERHIVPTKDLLRLYNYSTNLTTLIAGTRKRFLIIGQRKNSIQSNLIHY